MEADLVARLLRTMQGTSIPKIGVTGVAPVTGALVTCSKSLKLQGLQGLQVENSKEGNNVAKGVTARVTELFIPDEAGIDERAGLTMGGVPKPYLDAWARLQARQLFGINEARRRQAIDDAGRFLDQWGSLAVEFSWSQGDLFDVPRDGNLGGLAWFIEGEAVRALGPEHAITISGRVFDIDMRARGGDRRSFN
jgi:hypothetical protein